MYCFYIGGNYLGRHGGFQTYSLSASEVRDLFLERDRDKKETWGKLMTFETLDSIVPITKDKQEMVRKNGLPPKISPLLLFNCSAVSNSL